DHSFLWICHQVGWRKIQQGRVFNRYGNWDDDIAKADVDLHWNLCSGQQRSKSNADAFIVCIFFDSSDTNGASIELDAICLGFHVAQLVDDRSNMIQFVAGSTH